MSFSKTELKHIQQLLTKKGRKEQGHFLVSGVRLLEEAHRHRFKPELVLFAQSELTERGEKLLLTFRAQRARIEQISVRDLSKLADTVTPQGIAAVFARPALRIEELFKPIPRTILVCENISDPGNVGTLCRSALAFGCTAVIAIGTTSEPFSPKVVRSSAGAVFGLKIAQLTFSELLLWRQQSNAAILAADGKGKPIDRQMLTKLHQRPVMLCIGSEADGLSPELKSKADILARIDHESSVESLNAAMAGTILLHDLYQIEKVTS